MTPRMLYYGMVWFTCGGVLGVELGKKFGVIGYLCGLAIGTGGSYLLTWAWTAGRLLLFYPLPLCRHGKCQGYDQYAWPLGTVYGRQCGGIYRYRCLCSQEDYLRKGRRFMIVHADGSLKRYQKLVRFRVWAPDEPG